MKAIARHFGRSLVLLVAGGLLGATLVRLAPGFDADEAEMDTRLSSESVRALREARAADRDILGFYVRYLNGIAHGELGVSRSLGRPVAELLAERLPVTLGTVGFGVAGAWVIALALALGAALSRRPSVEAASAALGGAFLCVPEALIALVLVWTGLPGTLAIALVLFPRIHRYIANLLAAGAAQPHILAARARGIGEARILVRHRLPAAAPSLIALAGVSISIGFGAAIPMEVVTSTPGIGQLAWLSAMARDLPVLVNLTLLVTAVTLGANLISDLAGAVRQEARA